MIEILNLALYAFQQLGVMMGVGAETVLLISYLLSLQRDPHVEPPFVRAVRVAQGSGLLFIVFSGAVVVAEHVLGGQEAVLLQPAFLFKWALIGVVLLGYGFERHISKGRTAFEGVVGACWYALFIVHIMAPVIIWSDLLLLFAVWFVFFVIAWTWFVIVMRHGPKSAKAPALVVKVAPAPALAPKPVLQAPVPPPAPPAPPKPVPVPPLPPKVEPKPVAPPPPPPKPQLWPSKAPLQPVPHIALSQPKPPVALPPKPVEPPKPPPVVRAPLPPATPAAPPTDPALLPGIHIMPQTPQELSRQYRSPVVQFNSDVVVNTPPATPSQK